MKLKSLLLEIILEEIDDLENKRIHLSKKEIQKIDNPKWMDIPYSKPHGALYYAMGDVWVEYLATHPSELLSRKYIYEVILKPSARILAPKTAQDYIDITFKYPAKGYFFKGEFTPENFTTDNIPHLVPDYPKMSKDYDGIEIFDVNGKSPIEIAYSNQYPLSWPDEFSPPHGAIWNNNAATLNLINLDPKKYDPAIEKSRAKQIKHPEWYGLHSANPNWHGEKYWP